jgi:CRISPR-associated protein Cmr4
MYQVQRLVFYYCVSPVHMGAGTAVGVIDNPIQREVQTRHPVFAGSGIKGAVRHHCTASWGENGQDRNNNLTAIFGPDQNASDHAGAVAFTDAQLVLFPIRSLKRGFIYATSPLALARLRRLAGKDANWEVPADVEPGSCVLTNEKLLTDGKLVLETFEFARRPSSGIADIARWLANKCLPAGDGYKFFRDKLKNDMVILSDDDFSHFVENATAVETHVRIDNETGTADPGGLFYTENLPPESVLVGQVLASVERTRKASGDRSPATKPRDAEDLVKALLDGDKGIDGKLLQFGGDATTGRGLVVLQTQEIA